MYFIHIYTSCDPSLSSYLLLLDPFFPNYFPSTFRYFKPYRFHSGCGGRDRQISVREGEKAMPFKLGWRSET